MRSWTCLFLLVPLLGSGCVVMQREVIHDPGPVALVSQRERVLAGEVEADGRLEWPYLQLSFSQADRSVSEKVERRLGIDTINIHPAPGQPNAGASIGVGILSAILSGASFALRSATGDLRDTDGWLWSDKFLAVGSVFAGIGAVSLGNAVQIGAESRVEIEPRTVERVIESTETESGSHPVNGVVSLTGVPGLAENTDAATLALKAPASFPHLATGIELNGKPIRLTSAAQAALTLWNQCALAFSPLPHDAIAAETVRAQRDAALACAQADIPGAKERASFLGVSSAESGQEAETPAPSRIPLQPVH